MSEPIRQTNVTPPSIGKPGGGHGGRTRFMPGEKPRDARGTFGKLLRYYFKEAKSLFVVLMLLTAETAIAVTCPTIVGRAIDALNTGDSVNYIYLCAVMLAALYTGSWLLTTVQSVIMNQTSQRIVRSLRKTLFDKLQKLPLTYHDTHTHGELMSRLTNDIDNISVTIAQSTTQLVSAAITIVGSLIMMLRLSGYMTAAALITVPLVFLLTKLIAGRSRRLFVGQQRELGVLNGMIEETIGGQKIIKAFGMEEKTVEKFDEINKTLLYYSVRAQIWSGLLMPFMNVITNLGYVCVVAAGGYLAVNGIITVGVIGSFTSYSKQFTHPLNNIAGMFNNLQSALAGAERMFEILAEAEEPEDVPNALDIKIPKGDVRFENVTFAYVKGVNVLKKVSFEVKAGQKIALVGATGAGKTTIVNLLTRFYDATEGTVYIDGVDIKNYKRDSLRRVFSVVLQDTCLFTGTIADNIRYGRPDAEDSEIEEAAKAANADVFIKRLKHGYNTAVKGDTDSLSQGQRQLLAISRAALVRAPILVLDEATSSVDTRTELKIQEAILRLTAGCTSFVIAHRLSTIRDADVIMVVDGGEIVESGSHNKLIEKNGLYAKMYFSQF
ncbi:MAG: ABC transporter ATP-binding protein/permease [Clostridiales bacterium]|jgi:ATP-binding cassette subfamily B protein|nr:ABC transporter ATP-binding protein/permease [Clostridiales bacterium]